MKALRNRIANLSLLFLVVIWMAPQNITDESWMLGRWKVYVKSTNLEGWFWIGVSSKTNKIFAVNGNWGPLPRDTEFWRRGIDEEVTGHEIKSTNTSIDFHFISKIQESILDSLGRFNDRKQLMRSGEINIKRVNSHRMKGIIYFNNLQTDSIMLTR